ncbi:MAG: hypothetical protein N2691_02115 [Patescibacteria group bacterium]|nr:hypothetical protein [Patescibacteria group bacterium]
MNDITRPQHVLRITQNAYTFFHPDFTVGSGVTETLPFRRTGSCVWHAVFVYFAITRRDFASADHQLVGYTTDSEYPFKGITGP